MIPGLHIEHITDDLELWIGATGQRVSSKENQVVKEKQTAIEIQEGIYEGVAMVQYVTMSRGPRNPLSATLQIR